MAQVDTTATTTTAPATEPSAMDTLTSFFTRIADFLKSLYQAVMDFLSIGKNK